MLVRCGTSVETSLKKVNVPLNMALLVLVRNSGIMCGLHLLMNG